MKQFPKTEFLSLFSIFSGIIGLALQSWLFSTADNEGLLIHGHMGETLSYILLAIVAAANFLFLKEVRPDGNYASLFPKSPIAIPGCFIAGIGLLVSTLTIAAEGALLLLIYILGILSGFALAYIGFCRLKEEQPHCLLFAVIAVYLIFRTLAACQAWSAEVQMQLYFFPLLGSLSLLVAAYYRAAIGADLGNCRHYLFFRNMALFCCLLSIADGDRLFYLSGAIWMATDFCIPNRYGKYAA